VTENGASFGDEPDENGRIADQRRLDYLHDHFQAAQRAIEAGVPLAGYFVWSLLDNFEWARGYLQRFGIVWVDYETLERTPKDSALWYKNVIARNGL
jgi:beta-glucosidase